MKNISVFFLVTSVFPGLVLLSRDLMLRVNRRHSNKIPKNGIVPLATGRELYDCASLCLLTQGCKAVFYRESDKRCYGYNNVVDDDMDMDQSDGVVLYEKVPEVTKKCVAEGFTDMDGFCILVSTIQKDWKDAKAHCETLGGNLIMFKTNSKYIKVAAKLNRDYMDAVKDDDLVRFYIGMSDIDEEGTMKWIDGTSAEKFSFFDENEPDNQAAIHDDADCAVIKRKNTLNVYDDYCGKKHSYICERPL